MLNLISILSKLLPVILLLTLGFILKRFRFFFENTIDDLKKLMINIALPAMLFLTFAKTKFEIHFFSIIVVTVLICFFQIVPGLIFKRILAPNNRYYPSLFCGFECGLIGYSIFSAVYGTDKLFYIAVIALGNSIFLNTIMIGYVKHLNHETNNLYQTLLSPFKTPPILAVILGLLAGSTGFYNLLKSYPMTNSFLNTLSLLSDITMPVICIVIGYGLQIKIKSIRLPLITSIIRLSLNLVLAIFVDIVLIRHYLHLEHLYSVALYTMFLLSPSFGVPIYMKNSTDEENHFVLNTISVSVLLSVLAFIVLIAVM